MLNKVNAAARDEDVKLDAEIPESSRLLPIIPDKLHDGRDEMNFAEFPLGAIAERIAPGVKTLVFSDQIFDQQKGEMVQRKLTITGSDAYGLPTSTDDEVLLGLVQLAKLQRFESRSVYFSRYQLAKLLGWPMNGQSYKRLEQALMRWLGVSLYYEHAWRDKGTNSWGNEGFHVLDNVKIDMAENARTHPKPDAAQTNFEFAASSFTWNKIVYQSFKAGNLKTLDFSFVMGLRSAITKRLYRFLDKRFYHSSVVETDLKTLAFEHVGLSRNLPTGDLKRKIRMAVEELVAHKFLRAAPDEKRFRKVAKGIWRVMFERSSRGQGDPLNPKPQLELKTEGPTGAEAGPLEQKLVARGVSLERATALAGKYSAQLIEKQIEVVDFLVAKKDPKVSQNPSGFLVKSIAQDFSAPRNFVPSAEREQKQKAKQEREAKQRAREARLAAEKSQKEQARRAAIDGYWNALSSAVRSKAEAEAFARASNVQVEMSKRTGLIGTSARQNILDEYALAKLAEG